MNITLTITLSPEVLSILQAFTSNFNSKPVKNAPVSKKQTDTTEPGTIGTPAQSTSTETTTEITIEQVRAAVQEKSQAGKREQIKKILGEFNVAKVTDLVKENYTEFLEKIKAL